MTMNRRHFLIATGSAVAVGCKALQRGYPEEYFHAKGDVPGAKAFAPGEERLIRSNCLQCEGGCGIVVRVVEGRAVKIEGNPDFPTNQGGLCPKGLNGLQALYDPDRIQGPMRRSGKRGEGEWTPISWDEAIAAVAVELGAVRARGEPHTVAVIGGRYRGHMRDLVRRFLSAYGSPNDLDHESLCSGADRLAFELCHGLAERPAYDWEKTGYVLSFGAGLIESFRPTAMMLRVFGHLRSGRAGRRAKIVQIDTRCGVTASRADEWVKIRPGTDAALALGIAHVLLRDGLHDKAFVEQHTHGFKAWTDPAGRAHQGFEDLVRAEYSPAKVEEITGVRASTIERLAVEFARNQPGVAVAGRGVAAHTNGVYNVLAVHALNALVGNIGAPGGVMAQQVPPFSDWPLPEIDAVAREGLRKPRIDLAGAGLAPFSRSQVTALAERLESAKPYPLSAALIYYTNPLFSAPEPERLRAALERVPFLVSFSPFMDETTTWCDLVLPDHTYLERWQLDVPPSSVGFPLFGLRQPAVAPRHDTRSTGDVLAQVAKALGGTVAQAFPADELTLIKDRVRGVYESKRGSIEASSPEEFWDKLCAAGGWWDPAAERDSGIKTASGRYELYVTRIAARLGPAATDVACLPHYEPVRLPAAQERLPFVLTSYKTMTHAEGRGANQPHLQEVFGVLGDRSWQPWVELHPEDAAELGVSDGDDVVLSGTRGSVQLTAVVDEDAARGTVNVPFEHGHTAYGRWAAGRGESVNPLATGAREPLGGGVAWYDTRVAVKKA